jgi:hypothetical protein
VSHKYTYEALSALPTIGASHFDNLKVSRRGNDGKQYRVWLSRMRVEDGAEYNNEVTVEREHRGVWEIVSQYQAE